MRRRSRDPEAGAQGFAVGATDRDRFVVDGELVHFDHRNVFDGHYKRFVDTDKIRRRNEVENIAHIFADEDVPVL